MTSLADDALRQVDCPTGRHIACYEYRGWRIHTYRWRGERWWAGGGGGINFNPRGDGDVVSAIRALDFWMKENA